MNKIKLGEIATIEISNVDKKIKNNEINVKLCNFVNVYNNWAITKEKIPHFLNASASEKEIEKFSLKKGQVAITKDSETRNDIGMSTYIADTLENTLLGYHCILVTIKDTNILSGKYLNVFLNSKQIRKYFENQASGSGQRYTLTNNVISDIEIPLLDIKKQKLIGNIFSYIDRKIELNNKINTELEAMAKTIYDYWFLQFEFPNEEGKPYKSSGGKMVWNEELKREIPEGWKVETLENIIINKKDNISIENKEIYPYTKLDNINLRKIRMKKIENSSMPNSSLIFYKKKAILFGAMRPYFHRVCIAAFDGITRTTTFVLYPKNENLLGYVFETLNQEYTIKYATDNSIGTQQPYAVWENNLENMKIPCVPDYLKQLYSNKVKSSIDIVLNNELESSVLISIRDFLLPLLINGQVGFKY